MAFGVADAYGRFMGRFAEPLAAQLVELAGVRPGQRALDVGCGPGALAAQLVQRLGAEHVSAVDPSPGFVAAAAERLPGADVRAAAAEGLPHADATFDVVLAQLVVHFMTDPVAGLTEMARVTRPGGTVGASVWDIAGGRSPMSVFWTAVRDLDPGAPDESQLAGTRRGHLAELLRRAGLEPSVDTELTVRVRYASFDEWWEPYTLGVGPAGDHVAGLDERSRRRLRERCEQLLPAPLVVPATAWCALAVV
ncbi:class I SAM-dependent methyltransferase [Kineococcus glutinatus]|uniref:Class I SAM-dependent methyltransferase n=1 Tax=Kineococcus glutinatus TaxID=1070872 RepID=A0ABP8VCA9_9ACTN